MKKFYDSVQSQTPTEVRFVILHHHQVGREQKDRQFKEHWDFMVEQGDSLATWQLFENPTINRRVTISAVRIGDHRKAYLDYEGPISRGRGYVRRVDSGTCVVKESTPTAWVVELDGKELTGRYTLRRAEDDDWTWCPQ
jgi:hypothetical protein